MKIKTRTEAELARQRTAYVSLCVYSCGTELVIAPHHRLNKWMVLEERASGDWVIREATKYRGCCAEYVGRGGGDYAFHGCRPA